MYCKKCGKEIKVGAKFCAKCGEPVAKPIVEPAPIVSSEKSVEKNKKKSNVGGKILVAMLVILFLAVAGAGGYYIYLQLAPTDNSKQEEQAESYITKAESYMKKEKYEKAIDAYQKAIDNDEDVAKAYVGMADAMIALDQVQEAYDMLAEVNVELEDKSIAKKMDSIAENYVITAETKGEKETEKSTEKNKPQETTAEQSKVPAVQIQYTGMDGIVQQLMDKNIEYCTKIYYFGSLPTTTESVGPNLVRVTNERFSSYNEYTNFVYSIYSNANASYMIGLAKYFGINNVLSLNLAFKHQETLPTEYNVDWSSYVIEKLSQSDTSYTFNIYVNEVKDGQKTLCVKTGTIILENGKWVLEKPIY